MKRIALSVVILLASSASVAANAAQSARSVSQGVCDRVIIIHEDGSSDEYSHCHTGTDGTR